MYIYICHTTPTHTKKIKKKKKSCLTTMLQSHFTKEYFQIENYFENW